MLKFSEVYTEENILKEVDIMKRKKASGGIDNMPLSQLQSFFWKKSNREIIIKKLKRGTFKTHKSRKAFIKKKDGKRRMLLIQTSIDRLIMSILNRKLREKYQALFYDNTYTTKDGLGNLDAVKQYYSNYQNGYRYIIKLDIKSYFDSIPHSELYELMSQYVDFELLRVIKLFIDNNKRISIQQGNPLSCFLANIFLLSFDVELTKKGYVFLRYIDDIVVMFKRNPSFSEYLTLKEMIEKYKIKLNDNKTEIGSIDEKYFLGYTIEYNELEPHDDNLVDFDRKFNRILKDTNLIYQEKLKKLFEISIGWFAYYNLADMEEYKCFYRNKLKIEMKKQRL